MKLHRPIIALCLVLVSSFAEALAQERADDAQAAVRQATRAYFDAIAAADGARFDALTTSGYRFVDPSGVSSAARTVLERTAAAHLEGSPPQGRLAIDGITVSGDRANDRATWQTYAYAFVAGRRLVVRTYSSHALTLRRAATGEWCVDVDHETEAFTSY